MIKKIVLLATIVITLGFFASNVFASSKDHDFDNEHHSVHGTGQLNPKTCQPVGKAVIDVMQKVTNDSDSGQAGNYWGFDYFTRHIQVWQNNEPNTWCAILTYNGETYAVPGQNGPGDADMNGPLIDSPVKAEMSGGDRIVITGTLLTNATWPMKGNVGTTDYHCNIVGVCPGSVNWLDQYFTSGYSDTYAYWGWTYKAGSHGTWVNQCSTDIPTNPACKGNSGNIL